ncbi:Lrp/AsnC family transcriptional regulator [Shewanella sp. Isolate8]|uniref:Lrp/AsnC family transcriptional regulator n=1 Tax=Shewanella sp. Isolate8 TaxID=2908529 RepID=UPI001EFD6CCD|nr:Lrp/AsnC family transcriptional regulator [Shewanella sp. Isolate8]MCG9748308.1 Lrp/AsnC family transcriptional regulator [Shewanella sp. Isolate8]
MKLDSKDKQILSILQEEGRLPVAELANRLNLSDTPCLRRIKKLEQAGFIQGYSARLDPKSLSLNVIVYAFVRLTENSAAYGELFEQEMSRLPQVQECSVITGAHDYLLKIVAHDLLEYEGFVKHSLGGLKCIASIESTVVLKQTFSRHQLPVV